MKSYVIRFFGILGLLLITNFAYANATEVYDSVSCSQLKDTLISVKSSQDTSSINFKYKDALACNSSILYKNLIVKMFYMIFGDFSIKSMDIVLSLLNGILDENIDFYDKSKAELANIEPIQPLIKIMEALAFICCIFLLVFFSIFYLYYLFNSAHDGSSFGKETNVFWTTSRLFVAIFLCLPLDSFGNFTGIQVIVMMFATLGVLLANVVWFIMPVFELLFSDDVLEIAEKNEVINKIQVSTLIEGSIQMQVCDIQARKGIYLYGLDVEDMTKERIENGDFGKCIKNNETISVSSISSDNELIFTPSSLNATKLCANNTNKEITINCGSMIVKNIETTSNIFTASYLDNLNKETRQIAYNIIGRYCMDTQYDEKDKNEMSYEKECALILNADSFAYINKYGEQVIDTYKSAPDNTAIISSINSLNDRLYNEISSKSKDIVKHSVTNDQISEKIAFSLVKGWLSASSFILDLGSEYTNREEMYNQTFSSFSSSSKAEISGTAILLDRSGRSQLSGEILNSVERIKNISEKLAGSNNYVQDEKESESPIVSFLFPLIPYIKEFNGMSEVVDSRVEKENCSQNFNNCARTSINPLIGLMKMGSTMAKNGLYGIIVTELISFFYAKVVMNEKNPTFNATAAFLANVNELLSLLFLFNFIGGALMLYLPGIIIFAFFTGNVLGWFLLVIKKIVIAPLWLLMHLAPTKNEGFAGKGANGYKLLLDILLRPSFIVFGVFISFVMLSIMVSILNVLFGMVLSTFVFFDSPSGIIEFVTNFILNIVYIALLLMVMHRAGKAMYKIPNALAEWFEMQNPEDSNMWSELTSKVQNFMFTDMKKIIYFSKV
jgi:conjugal transfer/type IV secretion protein DotA/TraY